MKHFYLLIFWLYLLFPSSINAQLSFSKTQELANYSLDVTVFDKDNDGDMDILFGKFNSAAPLWENDGLGSYTNLGLFGNILSRKVLSFDIDGDNDIDLVTLTDSADSDVLENDGLGNYSQTSTLLTASFGTQDFIQSADYGDIDGDGDFDIIIGHANNSATQTHSVFFYENVGTHFNLSSTPYVSNSNSSRIYDTELIDIDLDGDLDIMMAQLSNSRILLNSGNGQFVAGQIINLNTSAFRIKSADVDNDGDYDIIYTTVTGTSGIFNTIKVFANSGNNTLNYSEIQSFSVGNSNITALQIIDINNDSYVDLIVGQDGPNKIFTNDPSGTNIFNDSGLNLGNETTTEIKTGDFNGDSKIDLVISNNDTSDAQVKSEIWLNTSTLSISDFNQQNILLYPNPTADSFKIKALNNFESLAIYDITGKLVKQYNAFQDSYNISTLKTGVYFAKIKAKNFQQTIKLIKN